MLKTFLCTWATIIAILLCLLIAVLAMTWLAHNYPAIAAGTGFLGISALIAFVVTLVSYE